MANQTINNYHVPPIKVIGIGGAGCNFLNYLIDANQTGIDYLYLDDCIKPESTDAHSIIIDGRLNLESKLELEKYLEDNGTIFIYAGLGGDTGGHIATLIASITNELGINTSLCVTTPFKFEGKERAIKAKECLGELKKHVDSLYVIDNNIVTEMLDASNQQRPLLTQLKCEFPFIQVTEDRNSALACFKIINDIATNILREIQGHR